LAGNLFHLVAGIYVAVQMGKQLFRPSGYFQQQKKDGKLKEFKGLGMSVQRIWECFMRMGEWIRILFILQKVMSY